MEVIDTRESLKTVLNEFAKLEHYTDLDEFLSGLRKLVRLTKSITEMLESNGKGEEEANKVDDKLERPWQKPAQDPGYLSLEEERRLACIKKIMTGVVRNEPLISWLRANPIKNLLILGPSF